jgi:hypothetical protein
MRNISYLIAISGILFLVVAAVAWRRIVREPAEEPPTKKDNKRSNIAARLVLVALVLSAVAAVVAVLGWFQR